MEGRSKRCCFRFSEVSRAAGYLRIGSGRPGLADLQAFKQFDQVELQYFAALRPPLEGLAEDFRPLILGTPAFDYLGIDVDNQLVLKISFFCVPSSMRQNISSVGVNVDLFEEVFPNSLDFFRHCLLS